MPRAKLLAEAGARPVDLAAAPELAGAEADLLRDDGESDGEFARRQQSFAALLSLS